MKLKKKMAARAWNAKTPLLISISPYTKEDPALA
jgi:hypothetical protein